MAKIFYKNLTIRKMTVSLAQWRSNCVDFNDPWHWILSCWIVEFECWIKIKVRDHGCYLINKPFKVIDRCMRGINSHMDRNVDEASCFNGPFQLSYLTIKVQRVKDRKSGGYLSVYETSWYNGSIQLKYFQLSFWVHSLVWTLEYLLRLWFF